MKLNFSFVKKNPALWIGGAVIIFAAFYFLSSRGGASGAASAGDPIIIGPSGPSEAAQIQLAGMSQQYQLGAAQLAADVAIADKNMQTQIALATIGANAATVEAQTYRDINLTQIQADKEMSKAAIEGQYKIIDTQIRGDIAARQIESQMFDRQLTANQEMYRIQADNLVKQSLIGQVGTLRAKDRDNALISLALGAPSYGGKITGPSYAPGLLSDYRGNAQVVNSSGSSNVIDDAIM